MDAHAVLSCRQPDVNHMRSLLCSIMVRMMTATRCRHASWDWRMLASFIRKAKYSCGTMGKRCGYSVTFAAYR